MARGDIKMGTGGKHDMNCCPPVSLAVALHGRILLNPSGSVTSYHDSVLRFPGKSLPYYLVGVAVDTEFTHSLDICSTPAVCLLLLVIKIARMKDAVEWMIQFPNFRLRG